MSDNTTKTVEEWYSDELKQLLKVAGVEGRSNLSTKQEMYDALEENAPGLLRPFEPVRDGEVTEGDEVEMNHLTTHLTVTEVDETEKRHAVVMETKRGGRHGLIVPKGDHEVGKNGNDPHLERWRAGDKEWMNNSTDPLYIRIVNDDSTGE